MQSKNTIVILFISAAFMIIIAPALLSDGMFLDGVTYATISRNLAEGIGSFWDLQYTETLYPHFHEHPPLAMGIQSIFFRLFGDSMYVERLYSFATFILSAWLIIRIWKKIVSTELKKTSWLPLLFWLFIPLNIWAVSNNILENTMMIFTSSSVLFMIMSLEKKRMLFLALSGLCIFLAFLTKGFTSLFVLSFYFWVFIFKKINFQVFLVNSILLLLFIAIPATALLLTSDEAFTSLSSYFHIQVIGSIVTGNTVDSRLYIIGKTLLELLPTIIVVLLISLYFRVKLKYFITIHNYDYNPFIFLSLALSGVVPVMISMKQSGFYILATFPFFAIYFASMVAVPLSTWYGEINTSSRGFKIFKSLTFSLIALSFIISAFQFNRIGRDRSKLNDIQAIIEVVPEKSIISVSSEFGFDWSLHAYLYRYAFISLDEYPNNPHEFLIDAKSSQANYNNYNDLQLRLENFRLLQRKDLD